MTSTYTYQLGGLVISSPLECPELLPSSDSPQVFITMGRVPEELASFKKEGVIYQAGGKEFLFRLHNVARFLVRDGTTVVVDRAPGVHDETLRLFLFNAILSVLLFQRGGTLPLHASSIQTKWGAVLFAGFSGAGKSTILAEFLRRGYHMMGDDLAPIRVGALPPPIVYPTFPQVKLWSDAAGSLEYPTEGALRVRPEEEKFGFPMGAAFHPDPSPLHKIFVLTNHNESAIELEPLDAQQKYKVLLYRTAGMPFIDGLGLRPQHFKMVTQLLPSISVTRVRRPRSGMLVRPLADTLENDFSQIA